MSKPSYRSFQPDYLAAQAADRLRRKTRITPSDVQEAIKAVVEAKVTDHEWGWWRGHFGILPTPDPAKVAVWTEVFRGDQPQVNSEATILVMMRAFTAAFIADRLHDAPQFADISPVALAKASSWD